MKQRVMRLFCFFRQHQGRSRWRILQNISNRNRLSGFYVLQTHPSGWSRMGENVPRRRPQQIKRRPSIVEPLNSTHFHTLTSFCNLVSKMNEPVVDASDELVHFRFRQLRHHRREIRETRQAIITGTVK